MALLKEFDRKDAAKVGQDLYRFAADLYPICRSITGDGIRRTLAAIQERVSLRLFEIPTGTRVFDWTVPREWNIRDAYIKGPGGERIVDFRKCNLHVASYSAPVRATMTLAELKPHLHSIPEKPRWVPYRTFYYTEDWGFCLAHEQLQSLKDGNYEVCIDSTLADGHLVYGECFFPGRTSDEVLISCHACHPSLANDNLSGISVATFLAQFLAGRDLRYSYRFLFLPGTIGAIAWLARNQDTVSSIRHGLVLTCLGDRGGFHYKKSRQGDAEIDRAAQHVLAHSGEPAEVLEFSPYGYDERQYCSPGFNLPVGCLMRSVWGTFPEYHTSGDDLDFISPAQLAGSLRASVSILDVLEHNFRYQNLNPFCEPQLGRRDLYRPMGGGGIAVETNAQLWVLNLSDGAHSLLDIAERSRMPFPVIRDAAELLAQNGLLSLLPEEDRAAPSRLEDSRERKLRRG